MRLTDEEMRVVLTALRRWRDRQRSMVLRFEKQDNEKQAARHHMQMREIALVLNKLSSNRREDG
jgi:hypothetical protein